MKEFCLKAFKFISVSVGVLVAAYGVGWSGATVLYNLFKTDKVEAQDYVKEVIQSSESKIMGIHNADVSGIKGSIGIVVDQNKEIMRQNTEILKRLPRY